MVVAPSVITIAKYGFLSLVVTGAGLLIGNIVVVKHHKQPPEHADSLIYNQPDQFSSENVLAVLGPNWDRCITEPRKSFCLLGKKKRLQLMRREIPATTDSNPTETTLHPIHRELLEMGDILASLKITPILLEHSMLYCLMSPSNKLYLIKKGFNPYKSQGSSKVVTLGVFEKDVRILDQDSALSSFELAGYNITRSRQWLRTDEKNSAVRYTTVHYLFERNEYAVLVAVIFKRQKFMWIAGITQDDEGFKDLLFTKEATFENFTAETLSVPSSPELKISLPSTPVWFLYQVPGSDFVPCTGTDQLNSTSMVHPWLTPEQLQNRALVAIQELKNLLYPRFISFWLWTESLKGWKESCNILSKSYELNVAVSHREITGTNLTSLLGDSDYLSILLHTRLESSNTLEEVHMNIALDCFGLRVNIFICFEDREHSRSYFSTDEGIVYRISRPKFQLCSTEILGQRMLLPCDATPEFEWELVHEESKNNKNITSND